MSSLPTLEPAWAQWLGIEGNVSAEEGAEQGGDAEAWDGGGGTEVPWSAPASSARFMQPPSQGVADAWGSLVPVIGGDDGSGMSRSESFQSMDEDDYEGPLLGRDVVANVDDLKGLVGSGAQDADASVPVVTRRGVRAGELTLMVFFFTCGGPFGIESAVGSGGPVLALSLIVFMALVWALPLALLSAELSLMMPENGGNLVWVQRAFPGIVAWMNGFNGLLQSLLANTLLVVLFVEYLSKHFPYYQGALLKFGFVSFNCVLNIVGLRWLSRLSVAMLVLIFLPFVMVAIAMGPLGVWANFDWTTLGVAMTPAPTSAGVGRVVPPSGDINWSLLVSTTAWAFGGFDNVGSLAGEVEGGRPAFIRGLFGAFPILVCNFIIPIVVMFVAANEPYYVWKSGFFTSAAYDVTQWLGMCMVGASVVSNFGQFASSVAAMARVAWAAAQPDTDAMLPPIVAKSWIIGSSGVVRPVGGILFVGVVCMAVSLGPFEEIVQVYLILRVVNLFCEYASLLRLRFTEPDADRPFSVPGGKIGIIILFLPTAGISIFSLYHTPARIWMYGGIAEAFFVLTFFAKRGYERLQRWRSVRGKGYAPIPSIQ